MSERKPELKICKNGHTYYKSSNCLVCPICEAKAKPESGFLSLLSAPARRALQNNGISSIEQLSHYSQKELLQLHGLGKSSIPKIELALKEIGLNLKDEDKQN